MVLVLAYFTSKYFGFCHCENPNCRAGPWFKKIELERMDRIRERAVPRINYYGDAEPVERAPRQDETVWAEFVRA